MIFGGSNEHFRSGRSSVMGDDILKSDSQRVNESFSKMNRASSERNEGIVVQDERMSTYFLSGETPLFLSEKDFNIYEQFSKGSRKRGLGALYKVKFLDEEKQVNY
jgi:hypothetical protein